MPTAGAGGWKSIYKTPPGDRRTPAQADQPEPLRGPSLWLIPTPILVIQDSRWCNFVMADCVV